LSLDSIFPEAIHVTASGGVSGHRVADDPQRGWFGVITIPATEPDRVTHVGDLRPVVVVHAPGEIDEPRSEIF
jgi:hypothetical protein